MSNHSTKHNRHLIISILILSFFIRIGLGFATKDTFFSRGNRSSSINPIALNLITIKQFALTRDNPTAINEPLYTALVALCYTLFGYGWFGVAFIQSLLNLANAVLVYLLAVELFKSRRTGYFASLLFLIYPFYVFQCVSVSDTVLFTFLLCFATFLTVRSYRSQKISYFLGTGFLWGLVLLTRFSAISMFPLMLFAYPFFKRGKQFVLPFALTLIGCVLVLIPWISRNYVLSGRLFISTHGTIEVWMGYNYDTYRTIKNDVTVDAMRSNLEAKIPELNEINKDPFMSGIAKELAQGEVFLRNAVRFIAEEPLLALRMLPLKLWKFWSFKYNPVPTSPHPIQDRLRRYAYTLSYFPLLCLAIPGILIAITQKYRLQYSLLLLFCGYSALHSIVFGFSRLRVPLDQFLMIYASFLSSYLISRIRFSNDAERVKPYAHDDVINEEQLGAC